MSEQVFEKLQLGREATEGTAVAATKGYPVDPGSPIPDLDRGYNQPTEDWGGLSREMPGRGSYGVRAATLPATGVLTFEGAMDLFDGALGLGTVAGAGADKTWTHA